MVSLSVRHWWILALRGLLALLFGVLALLLPHFTLVFLVVLFGVYAVTDGLSSLLTALLATWEAQSHRAFLVLEGAVGLAAGVLTLLWPAITTAIFFALIALWALLGGSIMHLSALRLQRTLQGEAVLVFSGLSALTFGVLLLLFPRAGLLAVGWVIGLYALLSGTLLLVRDSRLRRRMGHHHQWALPPYPSSREGQEHGQTTGLAKPLPLEHHP